MKADEDVDEEEDGVMAEVVEGVGTLDEEVTTYGLGDGERGMAAAGVGGRGVCLYSSLSAASRAGSMGEEVGVFCVEGARRGGGLAMLASLKSVPSTASAEVVRKGVMEGEEAEEEEGEVKDSIGEKEREDVESVLEVTMLVADFNKPSRCSTLRVRSACCCCCWAIFATTPVRMRVTRRNCACASLSRGCSTSCTAEGRSSGSSIARE